MALRIVCAFLLLLAAPFAVAQTKPLQIEITEGVITAMPIATPQFIAETGESQGLAQQITEVIVADLVNSGLFRQISPDAYISGVTNFDAPVQFEDWKAVNAQALITGAVQLTSDNRVVVKYRLFDVFAQQTLEGTQLVAGATSWRRVAHKIADAIYARLSGESGYFDSRVVFISEEGPKNARKKRLAIMDYDGANPRFLTGSEDIVLAPRFSPNAREVVFTSYETGTPRVFIMDVDSLNKRMLDSNAAMTFAPRFSPSGDRVVMSLSEGGNTDIYMMNIASGQKTRLTDTPAIETAPSFSPDGSQIVFESDRGGGQQIYVMPAGGGSATRISFGDGRYGTPVWSPRGDLIAFTKMNKGRFHIGVMRTDGSGEKLLTASFLDEGPSWAPNGRVIMFFRETAGESGAPALYSVDITGRNLRKVTTPKFGSDPSWSRLLQ